MFTIQYSQDDEGRAVAMSMLPPLPTKPIKCPDSVVLAGEEKKEYTMPRDKGRGVS